MPSFPLQQDPISNIVNVNWGATAVEFSPGEARLFQSSSPIVDTKLFTISTWIRLPAGTAGFTDIFAFGVEEFDSSVTLIPGESTFGAASDVISVWLVGRDGGRFYSSASGFFTSFPFVQANASFPFQTDQWHHVFIAADLRATDQAIFEEDTAVFNIFRNRTICLCVDGAVLSPPPYQVALPAAVIEDNASSDIPPFDIAVSGLEVSLPTIAAFIPFSPRLIYADTQVWFGKFIDPRVPENLAKFIRDSDDTSGVIRPVSPSIAEDAFGKQTILFKGGQTGFPTNRGSGGDFANVGAITNFKPGPRGLRA